MWQSAPRDQGETENGADADDAETEIAACAGMTPWQESTSGVITQQVIPAQAGISVYWAPISSG